MHEVETAAYAGGIPAWHGLGNVVPQNVMTIEEALELGGINVEYELKPVYITQPWATAPVASVLVPDKFAIVRKSDNKPMGVVGKRYTIIQPREGFEFIDALIDSGEAKYDTVGSLAGGKRIFITAKTTNDILIGGEPSERIAKYLFFRNTFDGTSAVEVLFTNVRVVCANTENFALRTAHNRYSIRHTASWQSKVLEARKVLEISFAHDAEFEKLANELITQPFSHGLELDRFLGRLLPKPPGDAKITERMIGTALSSARRSRRCCRPSPTSRTSEVHQVGRPQRRHPDGLTGRGLSRPTARTGSTGSSRTRP